MYNPIVLSSSVYRYALIIRLRGYTSTAPHRTRYIRLTVKSQRAVTSHSTPLGPQESDQNNDNFGVFNILHTRSSVGAQQYHG